MYRLFFILSCLLLGLLLMSLLQGCSKSHSPKPGFIGQWWLMSTDHAYGLGGVSTTDYSPGSHVLQLQPDSSYTKKIGGSISESGRYRIIFYNVNNIRDTVISFTATSGNSYNNMVRTNGLQMILGGVDNFDLYRKH